MNRSDKRRQKKRAGEHSGQRRRPQLQSALNLALQHHQAGRLVDAKGLYEQVLQADPNNLQALHRLGTLALQVGQSAPAADLISKAIALNPNVADMHFNLGLALANIDRPDDAVQAYRTATQIDPGLFAAHSNLGLILQNQGRLADAISSFKAALSIAPEQALLHFNLGNAFFQNGSLHDAANSFRQALNINPTLAQAHFKLAQTLDALGDPVCFEHFRQAIQLDAQNDGYWAAFEHIATRLEFSNADATLLTDLAQLLKRPSVRPHALARPIITALKSQPNFERVLQDVLSAKSNDADVFASAVQRLADFPLFLDIMALSPLSDLDIERMLQRLRGGLLLTHPLNSQDLDVYKALAHQAFANEYIYAVSPAEQERLEALEAKVADDVAHSRTIDPLELSLLAMYTPLHSYVWADDIDAAEELSDLITRQITEPRQEQALRPTFSALTAIADDVSKAVQDQYEQNPYPRWVRANTHTKPVRLSESLHDAPLWRQPQEFAPNMPAQVLIAGCGTGQQALDVASSLSDADVLAVDLSLSSLAYAQRKSQELGVSNIRYAQADIMQLPSLDTSFDLIESVGVLHHMKDPAAGWRVLVDLLRPGGFMKIGLYSELARQDVVKGRALITERGYRSIPSDIRAARQDIIERIEQGDDALASLLNSLDFYQLSECRDLLFHVQEHRFSLLQIQAILEELGLTFLGFELKNANVKTQFETEHPEAGALPQLASWHAFEVDHPDTFRGMYQFWCQKKLG